MNGADLVLPDGIGVIKGAAMGTPLKKDAGVEFATHLMDKLAEEGKSSTSWAAQAVLRASGAKLAAAHPGRGSPAPTTAISRRTARW